MNAIQVQCSHCKRRFAAKPHLAGKRVKCPGCKNPIVIPEPNVVTSIEVVCSSCSADFLAESSDVGQHVACPACGTLTEVRSGQADASFSSVDSLSSGDPLFDNIQNQGASPFSAASRPSGAADRLRNKTFAVSSESGFLASHWVSGVVAMVALISLVLCLVSGHIIVGAVLLLVGLAVAGSGFAFPPPKRRGSSSNAVITIASVAGGVLLFAAMVVAFIAKGTIREGLSPASAGPFFVAVMFGFLVVACAMILFVFLVVRFGISRAASAIYGGVGIVFPLLLVLFAPAATAGPGRVAGGPGSRNVGGPGGGPGAPPVGRPEGSGTGRTQRPRASVQPSFPSLGLARTIAPGVDFHEVRLRVPRGQPGQANKLYVYIPRGSNAPKSLPCVFIAGAGAMSFTGMNLGSGDQPEHIPYAQAGYAVVAYEIDGGVADAENVTDQQMLKAITDYQASEAGIVNARNAIDFALAKISAVDPQRLYTAGHSSAAVQSLLLAENDSRIRACIAFAPVVDLEKHVRELLPIYRREINNFDALLRRASPKTRESQLRCPVFLFHARDDEVVPVSETLDLADRLKSSGRVVELVTVSRGGHYDPMISEGIPRAIKWLQRIAGMGSSSAVAATGPITSNLADSRPSASGSSGLDDSPFAESPFKPLATDDSSSGKPMTADSSSDESPFKESPFGSSPFGGSKPGTSSTEVVPHDVGEGEIQRLLTTISSTTGFEKRDAVKEIARIDPESISSEEIRQAVVEQLHELMLGDDHFTRAETAKALAKWGDSSSVSVLLSVLADQGSRSLNKDVYKALGRLKDPDAALLVAERLGDFFDRDAAEACLREMGPVAEDALILIAPVGNKDVCLRAIKLLGDVGSEKCFSVLREAQRSRDLNIRETGKYALRKIRLRQKTEADKDDKESNDES